MTQELNLGVPEVYQGEFGEFTITDQDRLGVKIYRASLMVAALCFGAGTSVVLWQGNHSEVISALTFLYFSFSVALGVALMTIHIYMESLHRLLQLFWAIGSLAAGVVAFQDPAPLALTVYHEPLTLLGVGCTFVALTGIYFKEAFCFNRLETKLLTPLVPILLMGHLLGILSVTNERFLLGIWSILFLVFAVRKIFQKIPADIGDKSVFEYLHRQKRRE